MGKIVNSELAHSLKIYYQMMNDMKSNKDTKMKTKNVVIALMIGSMSILSVETMRAQATATQTVTLAVNTIYQISTSGNPSPLTISSGTAGSDNLTPVTDNSTSYSITQNFGNTVRITANLDSPLPLGYTLKIALASTKGTSAGSVDISNATSGSAVNVVTGVQRGADASQPIVYSFSALASAGTMASTAKTVTLTITN